MVASLVSTLPQRGAEQTDRYSETEREAIYRVIAERRDVRRGFLPEPLSEAVLQRLLQAAHQSPSVGLMQPTRFIVVRQPEVRAAIHKAFLQASDEAAAGYEGARRELYAGLKLEGLLEAPQHICLVCDAGSAKGHGLGRQTMPETALYSTVCAVQNLWLAARAEGIGVGWVSILKPEALREALAIPAHVTPVAYLCVGYVSSFADAPDLERFGWETRVALQDVLSYDRYREPGEERE